MKTQIIFRHSILVIIALFFCINVNNGSKKMMAVSHQLSYTSATTNSSEQSAKDETKTTTHKESDPYLPQIENEHDIDLCDFKHHEKRIFWKCVANRTFAILYHIIILMPILGESFVQVIRMIEH